ncbi:MAG: glutathione S-transferase [Gammaproteobacteria bacterium]|nr:glutathione S-transferase [Gammaproteobacteria bacterium]
MLKLHGIRMSNYYSVTKTCLLEKGAEFEEVKSPPSQDEEYLAKSPMGKVPALETDSGFISETLAIAGYLEATQPGPALISEDPFTRAKTIELVRHLELDIELVARRCLPEAFFGATVSDEVKETTEKDLAKGIKAVGRLFVCDPFAMGSQFSLADIYTYHCLGLASRIVKKMFNRDLLEDLPEVAALMGRLAERDSIKQVAADQAA